MAPLDYGQKEHVTFGVARAIQSLLLVCFKYSNLQKAPFCNLWPLDVSGFKFASCLPTIFEW